MRAIVRGSGILGLCFMLGCNDSTSNNEQVNARPFVVETPPDSAIAVQTEGPAWSGTLDDEAAQPATMTLHYAYDNYDSPDLDLKPEPDNKVIGVDVEFPAAESLDDFFAIAEDLEFDLHQADASEDAAERIKLDLLSSQVQFLPLSPKGLLTAAPKTQRYLLVFTAPKATTSVGVVYQGRVLTPASIPLATGPLTKPW